MEQKFYICGQKMTGLIPGVTEDAAETHVPVYQVEAVCLHSLRKA